MQFRDLSILILVNFVFLNVKIRTFIKAKTSYSS